MDSLFYIQWHITNKCNLRCRHCYQEDFSAREDLDFAGLKRVSENILTTLESWKRQACIHLTGGEPFLKPELFSLLSFLDESRMIKELGIITNGLLFDAPMAERLALFPKVKHIKISLDGGEPEINDSIRPLGTFQRVLKAVSAAKDAGSFDVVLMFTAMGKNYRSLPSLIRLARDLKVDGLIIERFIPWGRGRAIEGEVLDQAQWKELTGELFRFFSLDEEDGLPVFQAFQIDFRGEEPELMGAPCVLGEDGVCVMPGGDVFPCRRFPLPIGNLQKDSLENIWKGSPLLFRLRDRKNLKGKCGNCDRESCTGCRSLAYSLTGDYFAEDPHCWYNDPSRKP